MATEKKPYVTDQIAADTMADFRYDGTHLSIVTKDGWEYRMTMPDVAKALRTTDAQGFGFCVSRGNR